MLTKLLSLADKPDDSIAQKQKHAFMIYMGLVMSLGGLTWGSIALDFGYPIPSMIPYGYTVITIFNLTFLYKTKNFKVASFIQVFMGLLLPFLFQWSLGGFISSGAVMLWAVLSVIGSLSFYDTKASRIWIIMFAVLTLLSWYIDPYLEAYKIQASISVNVLFFVLNILIISTAIYFLVVFFINIRDRANAQLETQRRELQQSQSQLIQSENSRRWVS
jgi:hypothetical protein